MANYIPMVTTLVSVVFTVLLLWQYAHRKKRHQLVWTAALALYGLMAFMEFLANADVLGPSLLLIKLYYSGTGPMVGLLGAGVLYLLASGRWSDVYLALVLVLSAIVLVFTASAQITLVEIQSAFVAGLPQGFRTIVQDFPMTARIPTIILNITGAVFLIGGSLLSYVRDRRRTYNIALFMGGILPSVGGGLLGLFKNADIFFEFELAGTILLFLGFVLSIRYLSRSGNRSPQTKNETTRCN
jgi:energy-converting hydrogenase Eha subunit C